MDSQPGAVDKEVEPPVVRPMAQPPRQRRTAQLERAGRTEVAHHLRVEIAAHRFSAAGAELIGGDEGVGAVLTLRLRIELEIEGKLVRPRQLSAVIDEVALRVKTPLLEPGHRAAQAAQVEGQAGGEQRLRSLAGENGAVHRADWPGGEGRRAGHLLEANQLTEALVVEPGVEGVEKG